MRETVDNATQFQLNTRAHRFLQEICGPDWLINPGGSASAREPTSREGSEGGALRAC